MFILILTLIIYGVTLTAARFTPIPALEQRAHTLSSAQLSELKPFVQFSQAAYCLPQNVKAWKCGTACDALPGFQVTLTGGDGNLVQYFYVGFWPQKSAVVVAHQGTNIRRFRAIVTDLLAMRGPLDPALFPGVPANVSVHIGFRNQHAKTSPQIVAEVRRLLGEKNSTQVITVGHSLGGALAMLTALSVKLQLPKNISVRSITYGAPRVGDSDFANFFNSQITDLKRVNNDSDLVPTMPGRFLGFVHPKGEIHILSNGEAVACSGNDNAVDNRCQIKTVPNILFGNADNHLGPYKGIRIGTSFYFWFFNWGYDNDNGIWLWGSQTVGLLLSA